MTDLHTWGIVAVIALVTAATRFLPFVVWGGGRETPKLVVKLGKVLPFAIMIYTSVKTGTAAISFWTKRSGHITHMCYMTNEFASYPAKIYNNVVKTIITYILPFALTAYYPAIYILRGESPWSLAVTVGVSVTLFLLSQLIWKLGIRAYESAGS